MSKVDSHSKKGVRYPDFQLVLFPHVDLALSCSTFFYSKKTATMISLERLEFVVENCGYHAWPDSGTSTLEASGGTPYRRQYRRDVEGSYDFRSGPHGAGWERQSAPSAYEMPGE